MKRPFLNATQRGDERPLEEPTALRTERELSALFISVSVFKRICSLPYILWRTLGGRECFTWPPT